MDNESYPFIRLPPLRGVSSKNEGTIKELWSRKRQVLTEGPIIGGDTETRHLDQREYLVSYVTKEEIAFPPMRNKLYNLLGFFGE